MPDPNSDDQYEKFQEMLESGDRQGMAGLFKDVNRDNHLGVTGLPSPRMANPRSGCLLKFLQFVWVFCLKLLICLGLPNRWQYCPISFLQATPLSWARIIQAIFELTRRPQPRLMRCFRHLRVARTLSCVLRYLHGNPVENSLREPWSGLGSVITHYFTLILDCEGQTEKNWVNDQTCSNPRTTSKPKTVKCKFFPRCKNGATRTCSFWPCALRQRQGSRPSQGSPPPDEPPGTNTLSMMITLNLGYKGHSLEFGWTSFDPQFAHNID